MNVLFLGMAFQLVVHCGRLRVCFLYLNLLDPVARTIMNSTLDVSRGQLSGTFPNFVTVLTNLQ